MLTEERVGKEGREGSEGQSHKVEQGEGGVKWGQGKELRREGSIWCRGPRDPNYAAAVGASLPLII